MNKLYIQKHFKKMNLIIKITSVLSVLAFSIGCKSLKSTISIKNEPLPERYSLDQKEMISLPVWREVIKDSNLICLIDSTILFNQDIQSAIQRIEFAKAGFKESKAALSPTVGISTNASLRKFGFYTMDGAGNATTDIAPGQLVPVNLPDFYSGLFASWEIDLWSKLRSKKSYFYANYLQSNEVYKQIYGAILAEIAVSYYQLINLDRKLELIDASLGRQKEILNVMIEQKEAGIVNESSIQQFIAQGKEMEIMQNDVLSEVLKTENYINFLIGRFPQKIKRSNRLDTKDIVKLTSIGFPSQILENRIDVKIASIELEKSKIQTKIARSEFLPSFSMMSNIGFQAFNPKYLIQSPASIAYNIFGNLSAPLINRAAIKAEFSRAKSTQIDALYQYQKTILSAYIDVIDNLNIIKKLDVGLILRAERLGALSKASDFSKELFKSSRVNYLEVLITRQAELDAQWEYLNNSSELMIANIALYKALGGFVN